MDVWQCARQIAFLIGAATWAEAPSALVLTGGAFVSEDHEGNFAPGSFVPDGPAPKDLPFARVQPLAVKPDPDAPGRGMATIRVFIVAGSWVVEGGDSGTAGANDSHGIAQETGAIRDPSQGQGKSKGRSTDELVSRLLEVLATSGVPGQLADSIHGVQGEAVEAGERIPVDGVSVLARSFDVVVRTATLTRHYHPARGLALANAGGGTVNVSWTASPARFDSKSYVVRRGTNPGDAPPATITGGTSVPLTGATTAQATGLATGQSYSFSVFAAYDETGSGAADRWSEPVSRSVAT